MDGILRKTESGGSDATFAAAGLVLARGKLSSPFWTDLARLAEEAFPPEERFPPERLLEMTDRGVEVWEVRETVDPVPGTSAAASPASESSAPETPVSETPVSEPSVSGTPLPAERFVGFMALWTWKDMTHLFYLAVREDLRSRGYGSRCLRALRALHGDRKLVVDFEMPDGKAPNNAQRLRRRAFYLRNGFLETGLFYSWAGVDFEIVSTSPEFSGDDFMAMTRTLGGDGYRPRFFGRLPRRPRQS